MHGPNIFHYATKELSQDAFICWLASWADPAFRTVDEGLHRTGTMFVNRLLDVAGLEKPAEYRSVRVRRQVKNIDVLLVVNEAFDKDKLAILIEDKVHSGEHGNQLSDYMGKIQEEFKDRIAPVYVKTGDQGNYDSVKNKAKYGLFLREHFLEVLAYGKELDVQNHVFTAFHEHLLAIECAVQSFLTRPPGEWDNWDDTSQLKNQSLLRLLAGSRWKGFFLALQKKLDEKANWGYVPNSAGGFMGFWWYWHGDKYLLLANDKLCFKIHVSDPLEQTAKWNEWHNALMEVAKKDTNVIQLKRPPRRSAGKDMTVAMMNGYLKTNEQGLLDLDKTVEVLRNAERLMDAAVKAGGN